MYYLGPCLFLNNILTGKLHVVVEGNSKVPYFPEDHTKAVCIQSGCKLRNFLLLLERFRSRPYARKSVAEEHVAVLHKILQLQVGNFDFYLERAAPYLLQLDENIVRRDVSMVFHRRKVVDRQQNSGELKCDFIFYPKKSRERLVFQDLVYVVLAVAVFVQKLV